MYRVLTRIIKQDTSLTKDEEARRVANVYDFWDKNSSRYQKIVKNLTSDNESAVEDYFRYLGFWMQFKLLCEGKEVIIENILPLDITQIYSFMVRAKMLDAECF